MVNYAEALKRPFREMDNLLMYFVFSIIPIINLIGVGYSLDVAQTAMKKQKKLPEFKNYSKLFIEGLTMVVINFVYMIPVLILMAILAVLGFVSSSVGNMAGLAMMSASSIVVIILYMIVIYFATGAMLRFAEKREFNEAFNFKEISKKVFTGTYFIGWLISVVLSCLLVVVPYILYFALIMFLGIIGWIIGFIILVLAIAVVMLFYMTAMGQVYIEA